MNIRRICSRVKFHARYFRCKKTNAPKLFSAVEFRLRLAHPSLTTKAVSVAVLSFLQKTDAFLGKKQKIFRIEAINQ